MFLWRVCLTVTTKEGPYSGGYWTTFRLCINVSQYILQAMIECKCWNSCLKVFMYIEMHVHVWVNEL